MEKNELRELARTFFSYQRDSYIDAVIKSGSDLRLALNVWDDLWGQTEKFRSFCSVFKEEKSQDSGVARIGTVEGDGNLYVMIHSWDESKAHIEFGELVDKTVRVTIEVVD